MMLLFIEEAKPAVRHVLVFIQECIQNYRNCLKQLKLNPESAIVKCILYNKPGKTIPCWSRE